MVSSQRLALHTTLDSVDVEAVCGARLEVGNLSEGVPIYGHIKIPLWGGIGLQGSHVHAITRHVTRWRGPGDHEPCGRNGVKLHVGWGLDFL